MQQASSIWNKGNGHNSDMWAILSPGSEKSDHFLPPARKVGMFQQQFDKTRSRSLPPGRRDTVGTVPSHTQVQPAVGFEGERGDQQALIPARRDSVLHMHVLQLEERLERGTQEVQELRLRNEYAHREAAQTRAQLQNIQQHVLELQSKSAVHEQDSRSLAALRQMLHKYQQQLSAEVASTDAKGQLTAQEGRNSINSLQGLVQQLQSSLISEKASAEQAHSSLSTGVHSLQLAVAKDSANIATLQQAEAEVHSNLTTVQSKLQHEQNIRMEDRSAIRQELTHLKEVADNQIRSAKEEALNKIEEKSRALQAMHEQVTADLRRADQQNKRELQINDQLLASMQANDKEGFLARFMSVEGTLKDSISKQLSAEKHLDAKIVAHDSKVNQMILHVDSRMKQSETLLREQVESAMSRLRAYARDVEQHMGQASARLEGVMKVEIQARKESNSQLRAENLHNLGRMSASMHKVDKKVEVILEAQKMLHSYHHALQADHDRHKQETSTRVDELASHVEREVNACRDKLDREISAVQGDVVAKCKAVESMCQESVQDLQEDTQAKLNQMWEALTKRNDEMDATSSATRKELLTAISSSMELIKGIGDAVERIELTDMADLQKHMEAMAQTMEEEQTLIRQKIDDTAQDVKAEVQEMASDLQAGIDDVCESVNQNTSQCEGLQARHDKLREELLMLLSTECDKRQDSIAVLRSSFSNDMNEQRLSLKALSDSTEEAIGSVRESIANNSNMLNDARAAHSCLVQEVQALQQLVEDNKITHDAGLTTAFSQCTDRIEMEVAKLQADVNLCAKGEGLTEVQGSVSLINERLQEISSQEEQDVQHLHSKLDSLGTSADKLRVAYEQLATEHATTRGLVSSEVSRLQTDIEANTLKSQETLTDVGGIQASIAVLTEQMEACVTQEDYEHSLAFLATKPDVENLKEKTDDLKTLLDAQQEFAESLDTHKADKRIVDNLNEGVEALKLDVQQLRNGKADVESTEAIKEDLSGVRGTISTLATLEAAEAVRAEVEGLVTKCQELESTKANMSDLQSTINTMDQLQEYSNAGIAALKDMTSSMNEMLQKQELQLCEHKEATSTIQEQLAMKANSEDAKKLQDEMQQLQQQAESFATVAQVDSISQAIETVQQGLKEAVETMDQDVKAIGDGQNSASAELTAALDAQHQKQQAAFDEQLASIRENLEQLQARVDERKSDGAKAVEKMQDAIGEIGKAYATVIQLEELRNVVDGKADSQVLNHLTGGNSQSLQEIQHKIEELEQQQAAAVKATNDSLATKADAADVASLSSAMQQQQHNSASTAAIDQLQQSLDAAVAQIHAQKEQLDSYQETMASRTTNDAEQHQQLSDSIAKAREIAEAAASASDTAALSDKLANIEAGMPSKEELESVQAQLAKLEKGMSALDDLSSMHSQVQAMSTELRKVKALESALEDAKSRNQVIDGDIETLQRQLEAADTRTGRLQQEISALEAQLQAANTAASQVTKLEKDVEQLDEHVKSLQVLQQQVEVVEKQAAAAADHEALSALQEQFLKVDDKLAQTIAKEEAEHMMEVLRDNLQTQLDGIKYTGDKVDDAQDAKLRDLEERLKASLESDINKEQDRKLHELDSRMRKVIQQVASAPVEVNLSDDAKKAIVADLERRVKMLEASGG